MKSHRGLAPLITACANYHALHIISVQITIAASALLVLALTVLFDRALMALSHTR